MSQDFECAGEGHSWVTLSGDDGICSLDPDSLCACGSMTWLEGMMLSAKVKRKKEHDQLVIQLEEANATIRKLRSNLEKALCPVGW